MKNTLLLSVLLGSIFLVGCTVRHGSEEVALCSSHDIHTEIVDGETTKQQIADRFGMTFAIHFDELGREQWKYSYRKKSLSNGIILANTLLVVFDESDVVTKHLFYSNQEAER